MSELFKTIKKQFKVIKNEMNGLKLKIERDFEKMEKEINDMSISNLFNKFIGKFTMVYT